MYFDKIKTQSELAGLLEKIRSDKTVVFTNGCFDIVHAGHVYYLAGAKKLGDILVVAVNSDESVRKIKPVGRPINGQQERMEVLAAFEMIDYVVMFSEETPYNIIDLLRPDILVKGSDYNAEDIVGVDILESYGGKVQTIPYKPNCSSTNIIEKIKQHG